MQEAEFRTSCTRSLLCILLSEKCLMTETFKLEREIGIQLQKREECCRCSLIVKV